MIIVAIAFIFMIIFKDWNDSIVESASLDTKCPITPIELADVYDDYKQPEKQRKGYMHCFCLTTYQETGEISQTMETFKKIDSGIEENPCEEWLWRYENSFKLSIIAPAMVALINIIVCLIFELVAPLEKCLTFTEEDRGIFKRIVVIQFLNVGCLFLFSDFSLAFERSDGLPVLNGKYRDFDTPWFYDIGGKVTIAMLSNSLSPHFARSFEPFLHRLVFRWWFDRCCNRHLRKKSNMDEESGKDEGND